MKLPWSLQLLGGLQARSADNNVVSHFRTQKTGALLAYLATFPRSPHSRETLIERFWPDDDWDAARQSLRVALASLRRVLEPPPLTQGAVLAADRVFVRLVDEAFTTDAQVFENAVRHAHLPTQILGSGDGSGQTLGCGAQIQNWDAAIALYGGPFLPGYYDDWILAERDRLHDLWRIAHLRLANCCDETGDWRRGLSVLDALFADANETGDEDDTSEWASEARRLRARLQTKQKAASGRNPSAASPPSAVQALLPTDGFWGRDAEIAELCGWFHDSDARFVTLTGPGGTGKTRLVLQTAALLGKGECGDEAGQSVPVHIAPLAAVFDARRLPEAIGDALGLPRSKSTNDSAPLDAVIARLNDGPPALLLLDNLEQIAGMEAAQTLRALLAGVPHLTCFATSRRRIGVPGERLFAVPPLSLPNAISLFAERAQASNPDFTLRNDAVRADVEALCKELEGIPLAIELAAAWSAALSPHEMRERLQERFALLSSRRVDKTDRHRSLWAAIAWSYDLLPRDLRTTWERLSVFRGGWTMEAARAIAGSDSNENEITENLTRLRERSLLVPLESGHKGSMRFGMLASLREFAHEQLSEREQTASRQKHARYFAQLVREAQDHLRRADHGDLMKRLDDELPNLRHALHWFAEAIQNQETEEQEAEEAEAYLLFVSAFAAFCRHLGYVRDSREHLDLALARTAAARTAVLFSPKVQAARASTSNAAGLVAWMQGDVPCATEYFEQARAYWQAQNDPKGIGIVLGNLALLAMENDEQEKAWELCNEALPLLRQVGDTKPIANALGTMGNARLEQERWAEGRAYHEESLALYRQMDDMNGVSIALASLGYAAQFDGDFVSASVYYEESLEIRHELGDKWRVAFSLVSIASLLWVQKQALPALTLNAAAEKLREDLGAPVSASRRRHMDERQAAMREHVGAAAADKATAKGASMDYDAAVAFALHCLT